MCYLIQVDKLVKFADIIVSRQGLVKVLSVQLGFIGCVAVSLTECLVVGSL